MRKIVYLGHKDRKFDNIAQTGLAWARGEILEVADDKKAEKLLEHADIWADAEKPFQLRPVLAVVAPGLEPRVEILPQGGEFVSATWEPIKLTVPADVFKRLQDKEYVALFVKPEDADAFSAWKNEKDTKADAKGDAKPTTTLSLPKGEKKAVG